MIAKARFIIKILIATLGGWFIYQGVCDLAEQNGYPLSPITQVVIGVIIVYLDYKIK